MKNLCICLFLVICAKTVSATPSTQVIQSCLTMEPVDESVRYVNLKPDVFNEEDDEDAKTTSRTIIYRNQKVGIWEKAGSDNFGLVYGDRKIPASRVARLGKYPPSPFTPYTAAWGEARDDRHTYLCITFNLEGLGQSGSFQNIRGLYLIETSGPRPKFFYTMSDIRKTYEKR